jgi:rRNA-processing protein FCF1
MKPPAYVVDTQTLVWFAKGLVGNLGLNAFVALIHPRARVLVPSYVLEEIQRKFARKVNSNREIKIPPTALLRVLLHCSNARILPRGEAVLAREFKLQTNVAKRAEVVSSQDIPIAAAVLVVRDFYPGPVVLITSDRGLRKWAASIGVPVLSRQPPFQFLPT